MALNDIREWIIAYDIADRRRLARVHRHLVKHAMPLQYSVFMAPMSTVQARRLKEELAALIDPKADDVRMYPLPAQPEIIRLGRKDVASQGVYIA